MERTPACGPMTRQRVNIWGSIRGLPTSTPEREDCYAVIQATLWRDKPYTWLFYRNAYYAFSKKLRGYTYSPRGPFGFSPGFQSVWAAGH